MFSSFFDKALDTALSFFTRPLPQPEAPQQNQTPTMNNYPSPGGSGPNHYTQTNNYYSYYYPGATPPFPPGSPGSTELPQTPTQPAPQEPATHNIYREPNQSPFLSGPRGFVGYGNGVLPGPGIPDYWVPPSITSTMFFLGRVRRGAEAVSSEWQLRSGNQQQSIEDKVMTTSVILTGNKASGKTSLVELIWTNEFNKVYNPTPGIKVVPLVFETNRGLIIFNVWDTAGEYLADGLIDVQAQCGIVMFDVTSQLSYQSISNWHSDLVSVYGNIPIVLCGNKVDVDEREVPASSIVYHLDKNMQYYDISVKGKYNVEKPFLWLARQLMRDPTLEFVAMPAQQVPEVAPSWLQQMELELAEAAETALPMDD